MTPTRHRLCGVTAIEAALERGDPVRVLLVERGDADARVQALIERAEAQGCRIWRGGPGDLRRMSIGPRPERAIAMLGPPPEATLDALLDRGGAVWLLYRAAFPSNIGFALRTAEVSGASGVIVDGDLTHEQRSRVRHVSMGADRLLPVLYCAASTALLAARERGFRVIALEDSGSHRPWAVDLTGSLLLVVGNERHGIDAEVLAQCDAVVAIPMAGFVPSYNLQAAMSMVAAERLRQLGCA